MLWNLLTRQFVFECYSYRKIQHRAYLSALNKIIEVLGICIEITQVFKRKTKKKYRQAQNICHINVCIHTKNPSLKTNIA